MKFISQLTSRPIYLALFMLAGVILAAGVIMLRLPQEILLLGIVGMVFPSREYTGRFYLVMVAVYTLLTAATGLLSGSGLEHNGIVTGTALVVSLALGETVYRVYADRRQREFAMLDTERLLEEAQSIARVAHFVRDPVSGKGEWSKEMYVLFGVDPAAGPPTLAEWLAMIHPEDREEVATAQRGLIATGAPIKMDYRIILKDGRTRHIHTNAQLKIVKKGQPPILMGTVADLTERVVAQEALQERDERLRTLVESAPIAIVMVDGANRIVQANPYVETVFGYTPEEMIGRPLDMLLRDEDKNSHSRLSRQYMEKPTVREMGHQREVFGVGKDGKPVPFEIGLSSMTEDGQVYAIAWITDIRVRREAQEALRQSEAYFKLLHLTSRALSATLDLGTIHESSYRAIAEVMDCDGLIISAYSPDDRMIRGVYARLEGKTVDVAQFPAIPLEPEGQGAQSEVIRTGESLIVPDYQARLARTTTAYVVDHDQVKPADETADDEPITRSAVMTPLKLDHEVIGVLQVLSYRPDAYTEHHAQFLESLAAHIVLARKNALLFQQAQQELSERTQAEQALQISEERYRTVSGLTSDYAYSFSVAANKRRTLEWVAGAFQQITGYSPEALIARGGWATLVYRTDVPAARLHTRKLLANEPSVSEFRIATPGRGLRWLRDYARPVWDEQQGRVVRIIGAVQDITERKHAEEALVESEKLYRSVFEGTSVGLGIVDTTGRILAFNEAMLKPGDYSRADIEGGRTVANLYYNPADLVRVLKIARDQGSVSHEPVQFKRKDGSPYDALLSLVPISIQGRPAFHAIVEDLTEQKRTESEIRRLFTAQERHVAELEALRRVTLDITNQLDLKVLLEQLVGDALGLLDVASGGIYIYHPAQDALELLFEFGSQPSRVGAMLRRGEGLAGRVLASGQPMMVDNYSEWEGRAAIYDDLKFNAVVGVPIIWGSEMLGVIDAISVAPERVFSREDAGLLARFADQAAIAIHNARLYETEQKARMMAEMLYATSVALTQSFDLDERLNVFLKSLQILVPFDSANVMLMEPDGRLRVHASLGYEDYEVTGRSVGAYYEPGQLGGARRVIESLRTAHISDTGKDKDWIVFKETLNIGSWIGVPLIVDGEVIGLYSLDKHERDYFTEEHRYAAETLAAPAAIAIQNARLFESETRQLKLAQTLQRVGALLTTQMQLEDVFENIFDLLAEVVSYDSVSVFLSDENERVVLGAQRGIDNVDKLARGIQTLSREQIHSKWWSPQQTRVVNNTRSDPDWIPLDGTDHVQAWIGAPLYVRGRRIGILNVDSTRPNAFEPGAAETVTAFANQAAVAIENARLFTQTEDRSRRLQLMNEITRIGTETLDLNSLLEGIVRIAAQLIGGDSAAITLWDEKERLTTVSAVSGVSEPLSRIKLTAGMQSLTATALREGHPLAIEDYYPHPGEEMSDYRDAASSLLLPLQVGQLNLGALFIDFQATHHFTDDEIAWASQAAELIALAVAKAEVYEDLERRVEARTAELQSANDRLVMLTRLKDEFVSNVSHELRTPIASIKLYHTLVSLRPEKQEAYLEHLHRETRRLENIVEGLLQLSRLDQGRMEINLEQVDLEEMAENFVADRALLAEERGLTLKRIPAGGPREVICDPALMGQAISVLFTNALNYTPSGGQITIETVEASRDGQPGAALSIQDTGPGIPAEELPRLFERFFRGATARSLNVPGTGLGLSIAHEIVERHGGRLEVASKGVPGEGTRFTIWLPASSPDGTKPDQGEKIPRPAELGAPRPGRDFLGGEAGTPPAG